jgi:hypothetical protein
VAAVVVLVWVVKEGKYPEWGAREACGLIMEPPSLYYVSTQPAKLRLGGGLERFVKPAR